MRRMPAGFPWTSPTRRFRSPASMCRTKRLSIDGVGRSEASGCEAREAPAATPRSWPVPRKFTARRASSDFTNIVSRRGNCCAEAAMDRRRRLPDRVGRLRSATSAGVSTGLPTSSSLEATDTAAADARRFSERRRETLGCKPARARARQRVIGRPTWLTRIRQLASPAVPPMEWSRRRVDIRGRSGRRDLLAGPALAGGGRSALGERLELRRPRRAAAALRHRSDPGAARAADRALRAARGGGAGRQLPRSPRAGAACRHRPRHAAKPATRTRLGLDRRQSRSPAGRRSRRPRRARA